MMGQCVEHILASESLPSNPCPECQPWHPLLGNLISGFAHGTEGDRSTSPEGPVLNNWPHTNEKSKLVCATNLLLESIN